MSGTESGAQEQIVIWIIEAYLCQCEYLGEEVQRKHAESERLRATSDTNITPSTDSEPT